MLRHIFDGLVVRLVQSIWLAHWVLSFAVCTLREGCFSKHLKEDESRKAESLKRLGQESLRGVL